MAHLDTNNILINSQHGFRRKFSCKTQLITTVEETAKAIDNGKQIDFIIMDLNIHTYTHTYIHTHTHTYIHTYIHTHIHTYIHTLYYDLSRHFIVPHQ